MEKRIIRIKFSKLGEIKYISHLDLGRTFMRALRRAGVPLWYSEGFSPHPKLNFALPLSVGAESECELLDVCVLAGAPVGCMEALKDHLPAGLTVLDIDEAPKSKFSRIEFCDYRLEFSGGAPLAEQVKKRLNFPMPVTKKSKKGEVCVDIAPLFSHVSVETKGQDLLLFARLPAGGERGILNPQMLEKAWEGEEELSSLFDNYRTVRMAWYDGNQERFL